MTSFEEPKDEKEGILKDIKRGTDAGIFNVMRETVVLPYEFWKAKLIDGKTWDQAAAGGELSQEMEQFSEEEGPRGFAGEVSQITTEMLPFLLELPVATKAADIVMKGTGAAEKWVGLLGKSTKFQKMMEGTGKARAFAEQLKNLPTQMLAWGATGAKEGPEGMASQAVMGQFFGAGEASLIKEKLLTKLSGRALMAGIPALGADFYQNGEITPEGLREAAKQAVVFEILPLLHIGKGAEARKRLQENGMREAEIDAVVGENSEVQKEMTPLEIEMLRALRADDAAELATGLKTEGERKMAGATESGARVGLSPEEIEAVKKENGVKERLDGVQTGVDKFNPKNKEYDFEKVRAQIKEEIKRAQAEALPDEQMKSIRGAIQKMEKQYQKGEMTAREFSLKRSLFNEDMSKGVVKVNTLVEFREILESLGISKEKVEECVAHENAHMVTAQELEMQNLAYAVLFVKKTDGQMGVNPFVSCDDPSRDPETILANRRKIASAPHSDNLSHEDKIMTGEDVDPESEGSLAEEEIIVHKFDMNSKRVRSMIADEVERKPKTPEEAKEDARLSEEFRKRNEEIGKLAELFRERAMSAVGKGKELYNRLQDVAFGKDTATKSMLFKTMPSKFDEYLHDWEEKVDSIINIEDRYPIGVQSYKGNPIRETRAYQDMENDIRELQETVNGFEDNLNRAEAELGIKSPESETGSESVKEKSNYPGDWGELLHERLTSPSVQRKMMSVLKKHFDSYKPGTAIEPFDKDQDFQEYQMRHALSFDERVKNAFLSTGVGEAGDYGKKPEALGVVLKDGQRYEDRFAHPGAVFDDATSVDGKPLTNRQKNIIEAHEKGHAVREFSGAMAAEIRGVIDPSGLREKEGKYNPNYVGKADEIIERMAQFKNYFGFHGNEVFTKAHLDHIRKHYVEDVGLDNGVTDLLDAVTPQTEDKFLEIINKYPI